MLKFSDMAGVCRNFSPAGHAEGAFGGNPQLYPACRANPALASFSMLCRSLAINRPTVAMRWLYSFLPRGLSIACVLRSVKGRDPVDAGTGF